MIESFLSETESLNDKENLTYMQNCVNQDSALISNIIGQGICDGSLITDYSDKCAEVFLSLLNVWCGPSVFCCNMPKPSNRLRFLQHLMKSIGIDPIEIREMRDFLSSLLKNKE